MSRHRLQPPPRVRPRYRRITAAGSAVVITLVALLAGIGVVPVKHRAPAYAAAEVATTTSLAGSGGGPVREPAVRSTPVPTTSGPDATALPAASGHGKRIVFDMSDQRVWLVDARDDVRSTYEVSGSLTDNLHPGSYAVYSRSRWAVGVDDSGVMQYFVRFTRGQHAAIGFHSIPTKHGVPQQTRAELGTPQSHGCIRQALPDAKRLWAFAPVGTTVVVTA